MTCVYCEPKSRMKIFEWAGDVTILKGAADIRAAFPTRMDDRADYSLNRSAPNVPGRRRRAGNALAHPEQSFARADRRSPLRSGRTPSRTGSRWASSANIKKQSAHCKNDNWPRQREVFPMATEEGAIEWFSPDPRAILPLEEFHVPHALRRVLRKGVFEIKIDNRFSEVIRACAKREDTWINREIIESYMRLHELGHAHSVEAWAGGKLAGGLYGVAMGGAFFGESMFHR